MVVFVFRLLVPSCQIPNGARLPNAWRKAAEPAHSEAIGLRCAVLLSHSGDVVLVPATLVGAPGQYISFAPLRTLVPPQIVAAVQQNLVPTLPVADAPPFPSRRSLVPCASVPTLPVADALSFDSRRHLVLCTSVPTVPVADARLTVAQHNF